MLFATGNHFSTPVQSVKTIKSASSHALTNGGDKAANASSRVPNDSCDQGEEPDVLHFS